jgi:hypothetical protein
MKYLKLSFILIALSFSLAACMKNDEPVRYDTDVEGVVMYNNEPLANADIHFDHYYVPGGFPKQEDAVDSYTVDFNLERTMELTGYITRFGRGSLLATLFDRRFETGEYNFAIPDSLLSNGIYIYEIRGAFIQNINRVLFVQKSDSALIHARPITTTDQNGRFTLNHEWLGLGSTLSFSNGEIEIDDSLRVMVVADSQMVIKQAVKIKPNTENFLEIGID